VNITCKSSFKQSSRRASMCFSACCCSQASARADVGNSTAHHPLLHSVNSAL